MEEEIITYNPKLEEEWKSKSRKLQEEWLEKYPTVLSRAEYDSFVKPQLNMGNTQLYHFVEWFTAIEYHKRGWKVLVEQYMFPKHKKLDEVKKLVGEDKLHIIQEWGSGVSQAPDLFIYNDKGDFFFVEVKRKGDKLSESQIEHFRRIEQELGKDKVKIVRLIPKEGKT